MPPVLIGILPRFAAPTLRHPGYVPAPLTTPGLRSGTPVRSSFVAEPPHCAFPAFGRSDPATNDTARRASLRVVLRRAASCRRAWPCGGHPGRRAFGECVLPQRGGIVPKIATHFVCVAPVALLSIVARSRHPAEERGGLRVRRTRKRHLRNERATPKPVEHSSGEKVRSTFVLKQLLQFLVG